MTGKKTLAILLRIIPLIFFLLFIKEAFFRWDGYSYYMRFIDFLPDLSLAFILWMTPGIIIAFLFWLIIYGLYKIIPKFLAVRMEYITGWFVLSFVLWIIDIPIFYHILRKLPILRGYSLFITYSIVGAVIIWFGRKYIEKILNEIESRLTPVIVLFVFLFILAVPFSVFSILKKDPPAAEFTAQAQTESKRPNIILIIMDALTAQDMEAYGYNRPTTPFLSEWSKDAVVFKRAYSASNWTTPTIMSVMTGQRIWTHKIWYDAFYSPVKDYPNNLPKILKDNGYNIYGFVQNYRAHPDTLGIGTNFLTKDRSTTFWTAYNDQGLLTGIISFFVNKPVVKDFFNAYPLFNLRSNVRKLSFNNNTTQNQQNKDSQQHRDNNTTPPAPAESVYNRFLEHISSSTQNVDNSKAQPPIREPFFAFLLTYPPHKPYIPPKPFMGKFGDADKFNSFATQHKLSYKEFELEEQSNIDILRKRYDEFILYSDKQFRLFITRLAEVVDMSNTIIILTADHGESFSHGYWGHRGQHLYESLIHIPLIIKLPGTSTGKTIDMPLEHIDIAPTILELAGIQTPAWMEGRSFFPLLYDSADIGNVEGFKPQPIFAMQLINNRTFGHPITKGTIAALDGDYKLIYYLEDKKSLLFNLRLDPDETKNIFNEQPYIAQKLMKLINANLALANNKITQGSQ